MINFEITKLEYFKYQGHYVRIDRIIYETGDIEYKVDVSNNESDLMYSIHNKNKDRGLEEAIKQIHRIGGRGGRKWFVNKGEEK